MMGCQMHPRCLLSCFLMKSEGPFVFFMHVKMTRRAFLALRVIPKQRKLSWKRAVKKSGILVRKMEISQNLWIRLGPEQFSGLGQVKTYPEMYSLVHFYSLGKRTTAGKIFAWPTKSQKITKNQIFRKVFGIRRGGSGMVLRPSGSFWSLLAKMPDKNWKIEVFGEETCSVKFFYAKWLVEPF